MERRMRGSSRRWAGLPVAMVLVAVLLPGSPARARVSIPELVGLKDRVVILERPDGRWLEVRILRVEGTYVVVQLEDGTTGRVPIRDIAKVRLKTPTRPVLRRMPPRPQANPDEVPPLSGRNYRLPPEVGFEPSTTLRRRRKSGFWVEWIGLRTMIGFGAEREEWYDETPRGGVMAMMHLELVAFALHWKHFYWEILRGGGGEPFYGHWGTAMAYPLRLGDSGEHELRIGAHLTLEQGYKPGASGVYLVWSYRPWRHFGFHLGVMQHSYPAGLSFVFGFGA